MFLVGKYLFQSDFLKLSRFYVFIKKFFFQLFSIFVQFNVKKTVLHRITNITNKCKFEYLNNTNPFGDMSLFRFINGRRDIFY